MDARVEWTLLEVGRTKTKCRILTSESRAVACAFVYMTEVTWQMTTPDCERILPIIVESVSLRRQCHRMLCNGVNCFLRIVIFTNSVNCF